MFYGQREGSGEIKHVNFDEIYKITMNKGKIPVITTSEGEYELITKFHQLRTLLDQYGFINTDRGTLVNVKHIKKYKKENRLLILDLHRNISATVSESKEMIILDKVKKI